jgi:hypothetical protein
MRLRRGSFILSDDVSMLRGFELLMYHEVCRYPAGGARQEPHCRTLNTLS